MPVPSFVPAPVYDWSLPPASAPEPVPKRKRRPKPPVTPVPPATALVDRGAIAERVKAGLHKWIKRAKIAVSKLPAGAPEQKALVREFEQILMTDVRPYRFVPTDADEAILAALDGRALTTDALAVASGGNRSHILDRINRVLKPLRLVRHLPGLGYYRPERPPPELST